MSLSADALKPSTEYYSYQERQGAMIGELLVATGVTATDDKIVIFRNQHIPLYLTSS